MIENSIVYRDFKGKWTINIVLPVMVAELSYANMDIGNGDQAMMVWWKLGQ